MWNLHAPLRRANMWLSAADLLRVLAELGGHLDDPRSGMSSLWPDSQVGHKQWSFVMHASGRQTQIV